MDQTKYLTPASSIAATDEKKHKKKHKKDKDGETIDTPVEENVEKKVEILFGFSHMYYMNRLTITATGSTLDVGVGTWSLTLLPKQSRSFQRRYSQTITCLILTNKAVQENT